MKIRNVAETRTTRLVAFRVGVYIEKKRGGGGLKFSPSRKLLIQLRHAVHAGIIQRHARLRIIGKARPGVWLTLVSNANVAWITSIGRYGRIQRRSRRSLQRFDTSSSKSSKARPDAVALVNYRCSRVIVVLQLQYLVEEGEKEKTTELGIFGMSDDKTGAFE